MSESPPAIRSMGEGSDGPRRRRVRFAVATAEDASACDAVARSGAVQQQREGQVVTTPPAAITVAQAPAAAPTTTTGRGVHRGALHAVGTAELDRVAAADGFARPGGAAAAEEQSSHLSEGAGADGAAADAHATDDDDDDDSGAPANEAGQLDDDADGGGGNDESVVPAFRRKARPEEETALESVVAYLRWSIFKASTGAGAVVHLLFCGLLVVLVSTTLTDRRAQTRQQLLSEVLNIGGLADVVTTDDARRHFNGVFGTVLDREVAEVQRTPAAMRTTFGEGRAVGLVALNVHRTRLRSADATECTELGGTFLPPTDVAAAAAAACHYDTGDRDIEYPATGAPAAVVAALAGQVHTAGALGAVWTGRPITSRLRSPNYPPLPEPLAVPGWSVAQLPLPLPVIAVQPAATVADEAAALGVARAELQAQVDAIFNTDPDEIAAAVADIVLLDHEALSVVAATLVYERRHGSVIARAVMNPLRLEQLRSSDGDVSARSAFHFGVHVAAAVTLLMYVFESVREVQLNLRLRDGEPRLERAVWESDADRDLQHPLLLHSGALARAASFWPIYDTVLVTAYAIFLGLEGNRWWQATELAARTAEATAAAPATAIAQARLQRDLFDALLNQAESLVNQYTLFAWLIIAVFLRTFRYFALCDRLSMINVTLYSAANDVVGILAVITLVMVAFVYGGVLLWSHTVLSSTAFVSPFRGFVFLFLFLLNGGTDFESYAEVDRMSAMLYFGSYFFLVWVLLLNVVVGVVAIGFAAIADMSLLTERTNWGPSAVGRDIRKQLLRSPLGARLWPNSSEAHYLSDRWELLKLIRLWQSQGLENFVSTPHNVSLQRMLQFTKNSFGAAPTADGGGDDDDVGSDDTPSSATLPPPRPAHEGQAFIRRVFSKAQQQVGHPSAVERKLRSLFRAVNRGTIMRERVSQQDALIEAIHRRAVVQRNVSARLSSAIGVNGPELTVVEYDVVAAAAKIGTLNDWASDDTATVRKAERLLARTEALLRGICKELRTGNAVMINTKSAGLGGAGASSATDGEGGGSAGSAEATTSNGGGGGSAMSRTKSTVSARRVLLGTANATPGQKSASFQQKTQHQQQTSSPTTPTGGGSNRAQGGASGGGLRRAATHARGAAATTRQLHARHSQHAQLAAAAVVHDAEADALFNAEGDVRDLLEARLYAISGVVGSELAARLAIHAADTDTRLELRFAAAADLVRIERERVEGEERQRTDATAAVARRKQLLLDAVRHEREEARRLESERVSRERARQEAADAEAAAAAAATTTTRGAYRVRANPHHHQQQQQPLRRQESVGGSVSAAPQTSHASPAKSPVRREDSMAMTRTVAETQRGSAGKSPAGTPAANAPTGRQEFPTTRADAAASDDPATPRHEKGSGNGGGGNVTTARPAAGSPKKRHDGGGGATVSAQRDDERSAAARVRTALPMTPSSTAATAGSPTRRGRYGAAAALPTSELEREAAAEADRTEIRRAREAVRLQDDGTLSIDQGRSVLPPVSTQRLERARIEATRQEGATSTRRSRVFSFDPKRRD